MRRRLAATAAAALALSGPAVAVRQDSAGASSAPAPPATPRVSGLAGSDRAGALRSIEISRREETATNRHRLASALAAELRDDDAGERIERALAEADAEMSAAYSRGDRPSFDDGLPAALTRSSGFDAAELDAAFESMSQRALERRRA